MNKTERVEGFYVKLKSNKELQKYARHLGGDMSETVGYYIRFDGTLIPADADLNKEGGFYCFPKHVLDHGQEFLVIDNENTLSTREYNSSKALYDDVLGESATYSAKGVY